MNHLNCTSELSETEEGGAVVTLTMNNVMYKCMKSLAENPEEWIDNAVRERSRIEGDRIYKLELDRHIENGTMPTNPTKASLILGYEIPTTESTETS